MSKTNFFVVGGDLRQSYLAAWLSGQGYETAVFQVPALPSLPLGGPFCPYPAKTLKEGLSKAQAVVCPVPFSQSGLSLQEFLTELPPGQLLFGGGFPDDFLENCHRKQISPVDLLKEEAFLLANAALTGEGLLGVLLKDTPFSLMRRKALLLGFGRCGQEIVRLLSPFSLKITVLEKEARLLAGDVTMGHSAIDRFTVSPEELPGEAMDFDLVINTIPARVLSLSRLSRLPAHCRIFDIASAPFGFDCEAVHSLGLSCIRCPGLPGHWTPQTAGELMGKTILERILSHEF